MDGLTQDMDLSTIDVPMDLSTLFDNNSFPPGLGLDMLPFFPASTTPLPASVFPQGGAASQQTYMANSVSTSSTGIALQSERQKVLLAQNEISRLSRAAATLLQANAVLRAEKAQIEKDHRDLLETIHKQLGHVQRQAKFVRPRRADHEVEMWTENDFKAYKDDADKFHPAPLRIDDVPVWLQDSSGQTVSKARYKAIRAVMSRSFFDLLRTGKAANVFTELGQEAMLDLFDNVYPTAPELLYCDNDWKIHSLGVSMYSDWRRTHVSSTKDVKEERGETPSPISRGKHPISGQPVAQRPAKKAKVEKEVIVVAVNEKPATPTIPSVEASPLPPVTTEPLHGRLPDAPRNTGNGNHGEHAMARPCVPELAVPTAPLQDPLASVTVRPGRSADELNSQPTSCTATPKSAEPLQSASSCSTPIAKPTSDPLFSAAVPLSASGPGNPTQPIDGDDPGDRCDGQRMLDPSSSQTTPSTPKPAAPKLNPIAAPAQALVSQNTSDPTLPAPPAASPSKAAVPVAALSLLALGNMTAMQLQSGTIVNVPEPAQDTKKKGKKAKAVKATESAAKPAPNAAKGFKMPPADTTKPKELCKRAWALDQESKGVQLGRADNARFDSYWKALPDEQTKEWRMAGAAKRRAAKAAAGPSGPSTVDAGSDEDMDVDEGMVLPQK